MIVVGITGTIGSGKSTLSDLLRARGYPVIDIDRLGKEATDHQDAVDELRAAIGSEYVRDGKLDTDRLREAAFSDHRILRGLERIIHPRVSREMSRQMASHRAAGAKTVFLDHPLLFETGVDKACQRVVVVSARMTQIRDRLKERGMALADAERRMSFQMPLQEKEAMADFVVHNDGTKDDLDREVDALLERIKAWEVD
jgi:dephospho-CoA kinase